ncbi:MAG: betaine--homocysteine S-methyltransferase [Ardenticatenaceae bacterium]|nr:betaine--homocysteine S-methyltransferase [Ardenticatenaceae bacterium]
MNNLLAQLLEEEKVILTDGATGTQLFKLGLESGDPPEPWNVDYPERILSMHRGYIQAGSRLILTNSFGGTSFRLKLHNMQDRVYELNKAAAEVARIAADEVDHLVIVAGSIGPTGEILQPMGQMSYEEAVAAFAEQARGLTDGGADALWIETLSDLNEVKAAIEGCRSVSTLPICAAMTFDTKGRTMMGVTPHEAVEKLTGWGVFALGANCGNGPDEIESVIDTMHQIMPEAILIAKSNAGIPQWINNELIYDGTPAVMAEYAQRVRALGASIIGGCCGSAPEHIEAMGEALRQPFDPALAVEARGFKVEPSAEASSSGRRRRRRR